MFSEFPVQQSHYKYFVTKGKQQKLRRDLQAPVWDRKDHYFQTRKAYNKIYVLSKVPRFRRTYYETFRDTALTGASVAPYPMNSEFRYVDITGGGKLKSTTVVRSVVTGYLYWYSWITLNWIKLCQQGDTKRQTFWYHTHVDTSDKSEPKPG
jgi:hypothetical protein